MKDKTTAWYQFLSTPMTVMFGMFLGYLAASYSFWMLLLSIPYLFQLTFAVVFKERN